MMHIKILSNSSKNQISYGTFNKLSNLAQKEKLKLNLTYIPPTVLLNVFFLSLFSLDNCRKKNMQIY